MLCVHVCVLCVLTFGQFLGFIGTHRLAPLVLNQFVATHKDAVLWLARKVWDVLDGAVIFAGRSV